MRRVWSRLALITVRYRALHRISFHCAGKAGFFEH